MYSKNAMDRFFVLSGALLSALAVAFGAFGAHALKSHFESAPHLAPVFQTAVKYHMYHALALFVVAWVMNKWPIGNLPGYLFLMGTLLFSGSLYALSITGIRWLGAITPIGGVAFLLGWCTLFFTVYKAN